MIWIFYNILFPVVFLLLLPRFLYRMARRGGYARGFWQRLGFYDAAVRARLAEGGRVWIHAVSVGEIFIALKLMQEWRARDPAARFLLTTTTSTGGAIALKRVREPDIWIYFPVDFFWVTRRVLRLIRPSKVVLVELELWPNLVRMAHARNIPVYLVNGRISEHSFRGYSKLAVFTRQILPMLNALFAQSEADAQRLLALGAPKERVRVSGTAKYDVAEVETGGASRAREALDAVGISPEARIVLGGSTWDGEEAAMLDAFRQLRETRADLVLVLAPRHVERAPQVIEEIERRGLKYVCRSRPVADAGAEVYLLDTTGELKNFYSCADVIFVGKSLTQHGGQNVIEPALFGKPIIVGPNMENFQAVMEDFKSADAILQVANSAAFLSALAELLDDEKRRREIGFRAAAVVREKGGALGRTLDVILGADRRG